MKLKKFTLVLIATLVFAVTGCGSNATDVLNKAADNMGKLKNYNMKLGIEFGMNVENQDVSMKVNVDSDVDIINQTIKMNMKMDLSGFAMSTDSYVVNQNKKTITYLKDFTSGEWTKTTEDTGEEEWTQIGSDISDIIKDGKNVKEVKATEKGTKKYEIKITKENADKLFSAAGNEMDSADLDIKGDVKLSITVDTKKNYIKTMEMDLKDAISEQEDVTYSKIIMTFEFSKFNEVGEVKIPDSIVNKAKEEADDKDDTMKKVDEISANGVLDAARLYYVEQMLAETPNLEKKKVSELNIMGTIPYNAETIYVTYNEDGTIDIDIMEFDAACFKVENSTAKEVDCP